MKQKEIVGILEELKLTVDEIKPIRFESTDERKKLHQKISELYGNIQKYYLDITGDKKIEVPVAGSQLKSTYKNYFEAGYLSGRTFHSHQGYTELLNVIGQLKNNKYSSKKATSRRGYTVNEWIGIGAIFLTMISGSFYFGKYYGENRFDDRKIELTNQVKSLEQDTLILKKSILQASDSLKAIKIELDNLRLQRIEP